MNKTCLLNTPWDYQLHLDHPCTSPELQDNSIVGSAEHESILVSEDLHQCSIETEFLPEFGEQFDNTNLSPTYVFSGHHDYEKFLLQKGIDAPHDNLKHHDIHACEEQDQDVILTHATILSHTFALPQFMDQHNYEDQDTTDPPITVPSTYQVSCDYTLHPECTHNPMTIQCNQYPNHNHNLALPNFWYITIMKTCIPLTLQVQYKPLSKLAVITNTTLSVLITQ